ncbi:MAG: M12 family metallo-peptidase [Verrucomicrobiales bacterium]
MKKIQSPVPWAVYACLGVLAFCLVVVFSHWTRLPPDPTGLWRQGLAGDVPRPLLKAEARHIVGGSKTTAASPFKPEVLRLIAAMESGQPVRLSVGEHGESKWQFLFRPRALFADGYQTSLGADGGALGVDARSYEGRIVSRAAQDGTGSDTVLEPGTVTAVIMGNAIAAVVKQGDGGAITYVRTNPATGLLEARTQEPGDVELACVRREPGTFSIETENGLALTEEALWAQAETAHLESDGADLTGLDPVTGDLDKYVNRIPEAPVYSASLKDALLLLALDKSATGPDDEGSLTARASIYLATVSNVAAVYENQLGVRLLISELIMTPDSDAFVDLPTTADLSDFRSWVSRNRRQSSYSWTLASKFGTGLTDRVLGVAYVEALSTTNAVSMCDTTGIWDVLAHEMGHNFGSEHSSGGIMNASSLGGTVRSFFADVVAGETSAESIYQYAASRLPGNALMRDPEQIPFGTNDTAASSINFPVTISPLNNDQTSVRNGAVNSLTLEEVGSVSPFSAGSAEIVGSDIRFTPSDGFQGTAWFSYTLRGSVGNNGAGWLHKADVGVRIGTDQAPRQIVMPPGGSYSLRHTSAVSSASIEQPDQARVDVSRDDSRLLVIRAAADASGTDTFRIPSGNVTYTIVYDQDGLRTQPDKFTLDPRAGRLEFYPLANDEGAGERWLHELQPVYGVGTAGASKSGHALLATTFRLVSAQLLTPELGSIVVPTHQVVINGTRTNVNRGSIIFLPNEGMSGMARIQYRVQDGSGRQATELAEISLVPVRSEVLLGEGAEVTIFVPTDGSVDAEWMLPGFDDSHWRDEVSGIGYERSSGYEDFFESNVETDLFNKGTSVYVRIPFTVEDPLQYSLLTLRMRYDDGFVAYLNGVEVARANAEGASPLPWNTVASSSHGDAQAVEFIAFDISSFASVLASGGNILAIHGLNQSSDSSDLLIVPELEGAIVGDGAEIILPGYPEVSIAENTGLLASGRNLRADSGDHVSGQWRIEDAPPGAAVSFGPGGASRDDVELTFSSVGDYRLGFVAVDSFGAIVSEDALQVSVGETANGFPRGAEISIEPGVGGTSLGGRLAASLDSSATRVEWSFISGPGTALIATPSEAATEVIVSEPGDYTFRLVADTGRIQTFSDIVWNAGAVPATLVSSAGSLGESSALLSGYVAGFSAGSEATFYVGTNDGGDEPGMWERGVQAVADAAGKVEVQVDGLLANTQYFYRFAVATGDGFVWSGSESFSTLPVEPVTEIVLTERSPGTVFVPDSAAAVALVSDWRDPSFDDSEWFAGTTGFGYDTAGVFTDFVTTNIEDLVLNKNTTLFVRVPFTNGGNVRAIENLTLRMRYDDAFIAYLNGVEVARSDNAPDGQPGWDAVPLERRDNAQAIQFADFDITDGLQNLRAGKNVLGILGINLQLDSRDLLLSPEIVATTRADGYALWAQGFGYSSEELAMELDSDGDGVSNFYEYAFALNPIQADDPATIFPRILEPDSDGQGTVVEYLRRRDAEAAGIEYTLEQSSNLRDWSPAEMTQETPVSSTSPAVTERVRGELPGGEVGYVRLRVRFVQ